MQSKHTYVEIVISMLNSGCVVVCALFVSDLLWSAG